MAHHQTDTRCRAIHIFFQVFIIFITRLLRVLNHRVEERFGILEGHAALVENMGGKVENGVARIAVLKSHFPARQKVQEFLPHGGDFGGRFLGRVVHDFVGQTHKRIKRAGRFLQVAGEKSGREIVAFAVMLQKRARGAVGGSVIFGLGHKERAQSCKLVATRGKAARSLGAVWAQSRSILGADRG